MRALILRLDESLPILPNASPRIIDRCSRRFVCFPRQVFVLVSTVQAQEHNSAGVESARRLLRLRYLPSLLLAVVPRFLVLIFSCSPAVSHADFSGRLLVPSASPGHDDVPHGGATGDVVRLVARLDGRISGK